MPNVHTNVRHVRESAGCTQQSAAAQCGVSPSTWKAWELGHRRPNTDSLVAIAEAFGVSPAVLADDVGELAAVWVRMATDKQQRELREWLSSNVPG